MTTATGEREGAGDPAGGLPDSRRNGHPRATAEHGESRRGGQDAPPPTGSPMTHRQVGEAMVGLMLALIVAILSSTIVSTALPVITADLGGTQGQYTWVVTAMLLTATATTPLWGKLSDLYSKKVLYQLAITIFMLGSVLGGLSQSMGMLIGFRALQGIGMGGLQALIQVVIAAMVSPRERGRYSGYIGAAFAVATTSGPLLGGLIVDLPWLGWRWCFWVTVPIAVVAFVVLGKTLKLPVVKRDVSIDWFGALFLVGGVSLLLVWVSLAGKQFDWLSTQTAVYVGGGIAALIVALVVESRVREPIVPLGMFRNPTVSLAIVAMISVGTAMFGGAVFLAQYFQIGRGFSPAHAGLMTLPMVLGLFLSSTISGQVISRWTGRIKPFLVGGAVVLITGLGLLSTIDDTTDLVLVGLYLALMGIGVGCLMQNLVLAVQNSAGTANMGSVTSVVTFFRTLGGSAGVSVLGAVLGTRVNDHVREGVAALPGASNGDVGGSGVSLDIESLPGPIEDIVRHGYGAGVGDIFLIAACVSVITLVAVSFIREVPLRTTVEAHDEREPVTAGAREEAVDNPLLPVDNSVNGQGAEGGHHPSPAPGSAHVAATHGDGARGPGEPLDPPVDNSVDNPLGRWSTTASANRAGERAGRCVHGVVRGSAGVPVAGAVLTLTDAAGRQVDRARTGDDGHYRVTPDGGGSCVLIAFADQHQPSASAVSPGDGPVRHDVELAGTAVLSGTVVAGPAAIPAAIVVVTDPGGEVVATTRTGGGGDYRIDALLGGSYVVTVTADGCGPVSQQVTVGGGQGTRLDVPLRTGTRVNGTVRSAGLGHAVPEARVTLLDSSGAVTASVVTGADGTYSFTDVPGGRYTVLAAGYPPVATAVDVAGGRLDHDISLAHPGEEDRA